MPDTPPGPSTPEDLLPPRLRLGDADQALVLAYLQHVTVEKRLAARTVSLYTLDLDKLAAFATVAGVSLVAVQAHHIRSWVARMHASGRSGRGVALVLSGWRGFYVWAARQGHTRHNPVLGVRAPKTPKPLPKALGVDEAVQLADFQRTDNDPVREARDRCLVELLYGSGLRLGELLGLNAKPGDDQAGWIDLQAAEVHVCGKGGKRRAVPLGSAAREAVLAWWQAREVWQAASGAAAHSDGLEPPFSAVFTDRLGRRLSPQRVRVILRQRSVQSGLATPVHPHMLRHSFASHVLQSSSDLRAVQELLGHANIATTQVYTRLDFQHLAKTYDAAHPRAHRVPRKPGNS